VEFVKASLERATLGSTPDDRLAGLMRAALIGNTAAVRVFLEGGVPVNAADASGRTPLMEAVFGGNPDTIRELLDRGAEVNAQDGDGWTALMEAASKGRADVVRSLLAHNADPSLRNKRGLTALKTTSKSNSEISRILRTANSS